MPSTPLIIAVISYHVLHVFDTRSFRPAQPSDRARAWEFIDGSWGYDVARYTELLMRAVETVFIPFGVNASMLRSWLVKQLPAEHLRARLEAKPTRAYLGPLFELTAHTLPLKYPVQQG